MSKICGIGLENFKVFKEMTFFDVAPVTILTGTNNSGKSSLLAAFRILKAMFEKLDTSEEDRDYSCLETIDTHSLGDLTASFGNLINLTTKKKEVSIALDLLAEKVYNEKLYMRLTYGLLKKDKMQNGHLQSIEIYTAGETILLFSKRFLADSNRNVWNIDKINFNYLCDLFDWHLNKFIKEPDEIKETYPGNEDELKSFLDYWNGDFENSPLLSYDNIFELNDPDPTSPYLEMASYQFGNEFKSMKDLKAFILKEEKKLLSNASYLPGNSGEITRIIEEISSVPVSGLPKNSDGIISGINQLFDFFGTEQNDLIFFINERPRKDQIIFLGAAGKAERIKNKEPTNNSFRNKDGSSTKLFHIFKYLIYDVIRKRLWHYEIILKNSEFVPAIRSIGKRNLSISSENYLSVKTKEMADVNIFTYPDVEDFFFWAVKLFDIADKVDFGFDPDTKTSFIKLVKNGKPIQIADSGFGFSQLLSIIFAICVTNKSIEVRSKAMDKMGDEYNDEFPESDSLIFIEEPEANLHPALQSKLADLFVQAYKLFSIHFIIETHSEYIIRKLQYLTRKTDSNLKSEDTIIYYFYPPDKIPYGEPQVKEINVQPDGSLTDDFGTGFFDEADKTAISIWNMNQSQKN